MKTEDNSAAEAVTLYKPTFYKGRLTRAQYWKYLVVAYFVIALLYYLPILIILNFIPSAKSFLECYAYLMLSLCVLVGIFYILPLQMKRLQDIGVSGVIAILVNVVFILLGFVLPPCDYVVCLLIIPWQMYLGIVDSQEETNEYGPSTTYPRTGDRISAMEYRKLFVKWLLSFVCWNALPVLLIVLPPLYSLSAPEVNNDAIAGIVFIGWIWLIVANIILFFRDGLKAIKAQMQRLNDLGWDGVAVVVMSIVFTCGCPFVVGITNPSLAYVVAILGLLWWAILQGGALFKKGQPIPNKYGLPCNDDN